MKRNLVVSVILLFSLSIANAQVITIRPDSVTNKIPLFGYNMITANQGFGIIGDDGKFDPEILSATKDLNLEILRFPGGTYANLYEWQKAIGPKEQRGGMHGYRHIPDNNWFGPDEAGQLMEEVGGELVCVVNFNKGAQYAADWVEYMNAEVGGNPNGGVDWAAIRAQNGHPAPYGVKYWEIANEGGNKRIWPIWPYDGDKNYLSFGDTVFQNRVTYGGTRSYMNQTLVRENVWKDDSITTRGEASEVFQIRWYPLERESVSIKIGDTVTNAVPWILVEDFANSGPNDKHYIVEETTGKVQFGDGLKGLVPPAGKYAYVDYTTKQLDGYIQIYNAMKSTDPSITVAEAFGFIRSASVGIPELDFDASQLHRGAKDYPLNYGEDRFKDAVATAAGGFKATLDSSIVKY